MGGRGELHGFIRLLTYLPYAKDIKNKIPSSFTYLLSMKKNLENAGKLRVAFCGMDTPADGYYDFHITD